MALSETELLGHCKEQLAAYKLPRSFRFVEEAALPTTTTGKVQKSRLVEFFR